MDNNSIILRINELMKRKKKNRGQFADLIKMDRSGFSKRMNGDIAIKDAFINKIVVELKVNKDWLITGESEKVSENNILQEPENQYKLKNQITGLVPLLPISAQAGNLNDFIVSIKESECEMVISPIKGADFAMTIAGESMAPEYLNGSQIFIKKINEKATFEWGKVYVLDTMNGSIIKIITKSDKEDHLRCIALNPDQLRYTPFDIPLNEVIGIYRVMLCMSIK